VNQLRSSLLSWKSHQIVISGSGRSSGSHGCDALHHGPNKGHYSPFCHPERSEEGPAVSFLSIRSDSP
jgi:hypothetical protein